VSRFVLVDGVRTHVLDRGTGAPLVLLHGGAHGECADTAWRPVLDAFAAHRRVLAPDLLGFGETDKLRDFADTLGGIGRHLARLVEQLGPFPSGIDVVALSMGGAVLLRDLTAERPRLPVRRAVLVSAGGAPLTPAARAALADFDGTPAGMRRQVELSAGEPGPGTVDLDELAGRRLAAALRPGAWELMASMGLRSPVAAPPPPTAGPLDRIRVPVLVVAGEADRLKPPGWAEELAGGIPAAGLRVMPGAGHCPQLDAPKDFADIVLDFLGDPA
jgi:pimeloyl-ACP methyl ester carboxylesterase